MWMLKLTGGTLQKQPDFFIIASGKKHSVLEFTKKCFNYVGLDYKKYIKIEKKLFRPSKTVSLVGNINKAKKNLTKKVVKKMIQF